MVPTYARRFTAEKERRRRAQHVSSYGATFGDNVRDVRDVLVAPEKG